MIDLSLPGYKYLGPFNKLNKGKPRNKDDWVAYFHDIGYGKIIEKGGNPYLQWSEADAQAYNTFTSNQLRGTEKSGGTYGGSLGKGFFGLKKLAHDAGLISKFDMPRTTSLGNKKDQWRKRIRTTSLQEETKNEEPELQRQRIQNQQYQHLNQLNENLRDSYITTPAPTEATPPLNIMDFTDSQMAEIEAMIDEQGGIINQSDLSSLSNSPQDANMQDSTDPEPESQVSAQRAGGGPVMPSKETPISNYPSLTYGFQETHTTILPWTAWCSVAAVDTGGPVQLKIRMNSPVDMMNVTTLTPPSSGNPYITKGIYTYPITNGGLRSYTNFPEALVTGTNTAERPAWRDTWFKMYQYYTVLACHYEITVCNPISNRGGYLAIGKQFDSYTDVEGATGNVMPQTNYSEALSYKNIDWTMLQGNTDGDMTKCTTTIKGTWKPGMIRRNVQNDGDVKTWTATSSNSIPNMKELLTVNFWRSGLAYENNTVGVTLGANVEIRLKYIVQFKDLQQQLRYPNTISETGTTTLTYSQVATDSGNPLARWQ